MHVIYHVWAGVKSRDDEETIFNKGELIFFRELLNCRGVITSTHCDEKIFRTDHFTKTVPKGLMEIGIIVKLPINTGGAIYILDFKFFNEVFNIG